MQVALLFAGVGSVLAGAILCSAPALADDKEVLQLLNPSAFYESFSTGGSRTVKSGGAKSRLLVGLHLGRTNGRFDPAAVQVPASALRRDGDYCVRFASADARYLALNAYRAAPAPGRSNTIEVHSRYAAELSARYSAEDVPIQIVATSSCRDDPDGAVVPAIPAGAQAADQLVAYVNAVGYRVAARLVRGDGTTSEGACSLATNPAAITYSQICTFKLQPGPPGYRSLQLNLVDGSAAKSAFEFPLAMPP